MAGKRRRGGGPSPRPRTYSGERSERLAHNRSALLGVINGLYAAALERLPVDEMPALVPRLLKAGPCVGFSDPVSNIIVNTVSTYSRRVPDRREPAVSSSDGGKAASRRRTRRKALSRAVADAGDVAYRRSPRRSLLRDMPVAARSLEALVAFLTYYFRYLPVSEAIEYLLLAKADVLAAVRLVEADRNSSGGGFSLASRTTKTAFRCAALASCHPKPRALVNRSYSLAARMEEASQLLGTTEGCLSCNTIEAITGLLTTKRQEALNDVAVTRPPQFLQELMSKQAPFFPTKSLKSVLLDRIYALYLDALARLPRDALRNRYHRGLLRAGHCYGPLKDAVSNIVLNAVWYETMFPPQKRVSVSMISSRSLVRVACRSLRGLVEYLRASFRMVSEHQAMRYLLFTGANLWEAMDMARREGHVERTGLGQDGAYKAAAIAAMHPDPDAVTEFFVSTFPSMSLSLKSTEPSLFDVQLLSQMLLPFRSTHNGTVQTAPELSEGGSKVLSWIQNDFKQEELFVRGKVTAALKKYTQQMGGPEYELHIICGLNRNVANSYGWGLEYGPGHMRPRKTQYSHVNFLASRKDLNSSAPVLFFAECSNNEDVIGESSCWPVMGDPGKLRCFHCEKEGAKIVHPDTDKYKDRDIYFERMACKDLGVMTVDDTSERLITSSMDICEVDCIYFDANRDTKCANFLNARARIFERSFLV
ncbi:hypothetical protein EJB05_05734, partial [Eragrostis curvula]